VLAAAFVLFILFALWNKSLSREIKLRKLVEDNLKASSENNERYKVLFFESPVGHALNRFEDGAFISSNKAFEHITGYTLSELQELSYWELTPEVFMDDEERQLESLSATGRYGPYEKQYIQKNGSRVAVRLYGSLVKDRDGDELILSIVENISNKVEKKRAELANAAKSDFLSSMSHELRTPLNAILGHAQILGFDKDLLSENQLVSVDEILKGGNHLLELINDMLDLAKIEAGKLNVTVEEISLSEVIEECLSLTSVLAQDAGIAIDYGHPEQYAVITDRFRLKQILINYISNAIKYNHPNGLIQISYEPQTENKLRICVSDNGIGLDNDQLEKVFSSFERLGAEYSPIEGSGIGLSLSKKLAELIGASVGVTSTKGEGSKFWIDVDYIKEHIPSTPLKATIPTSLADREKEQSQTILYIEDNEANLKLIEKIIKMKTSYTFISAPDGKSGIDSAVIHRPDLILLDINLPGIDGFEVLARLRTKLESLPPIIAVSANVMPKDIEKGFKAGFDDYITKPFDLSQLLEKIHKRLAS